jgi:hypothetical protein
VTPRRAGRTRPPPQRPTPGPPPVSHRRGSTAGSDPPGAGPRADSDSGTSDRNTAATTAVPTPPPPTSVTPTAAVPGIPSSIAPRTIAGAAAGLLAARADDAEGLASAHRPSRHTGGPPQDAGCARSRPTARRPAHPPAGRARRDVRNRPVGAQLTARPARHPDGRRPGSYPSTTRAAHLPASCARPDVRNRRVGAQLTPRIGSARPTAVGPGRPDRAAGDPRSGWSSRRVVPAEVPRPFEWWFLADRDGMAIRTGRAFPEIRRIGRASSPRVLGITRWWYSMGWTG